MSPPANAASPEFGRLKKISSGQQLAAGAERAHSDRFSGGRTPETIPAFFQSKTHKEPDQRLPGSLCVLYILR